MNRIIAFIAARKTKADEWLTAGAVLAPALCCVAAAWVFAETGSWGAVRFLVLYAAPLFAAAPLWARARLDAIDELTALRCVMDAGVFVLAVARFAATDVFPFSGHMLFLTYTGLTTRGRGYPWIAAALIVETSVFKLLLWRDTRSWMLGVALGLVASLVVLLQRRKRGGLAATSS